MRNLRILLIPFYSQQDKVTGAILPEKCSIYNINRRLKTQLQMEGHVVEMVVPFIGVSGLEGYPYPTSNSNPLQRLDFNAEIMCKILMDFKPNLIITHNEINTLRLRAVCDHITNLSGTMIEVPKIIQFNHMLPEGDWRWIKSLQKLSMEAADAVVCLSDNIENWIQDNIILATPIHVWNYAFSRRSDLVTKTEDRDIDFIFPQRCSSSNYSHHHDVLKAIKKLRMMSDCHPSVVFTDTTKFLETSNVDLRDISSEVRIERCYHREDYYKLLSRSKFAISLIDEDHHGGIAIREAIYAGCIPVMGKSPAYDSLRNKLNLPNVGPYRIDVEDPFDLVDTLGSAVRLFNQMKDFGNDMRGELSRRMETETFESSFHSEVLPSIRKIMEYK